MNKEIYGDLFKNVVINGYYPFEKLNEIKNYIKTLNIKIDHLEQQCKKQKEVIDKLGLENKVLKEQMVAMVKPNYTYGIR